MSLQPASRFDLDVFASLPIQIEVSDAPLTSDAGLLLLRQFDDRIGLTAQFADALNDPRHPELIEHSFLDMSPQPCGESKNDLTVERARGAHDDDLPIDELAPEPVVGGGQEVRFCHLASGRHGST